MIMISNRQRDDAVKYLTEYVDSIKDIRSTRAYNTRRLAQKLIRALSEKQPVPLSELPEQLRKSR